MLAECAGPYAHAACPFATTSCGHEFTPIGLRDSLGRWPIPHREDVEPGARALDLARILREAHPWSCSGHDGLLGNGSLSSGSSRKYGRNYRLLHQYACDIRMDQSARQQDRERDDESCDESRQSPTRRQASTNVRHRAGTTCSPRGPIVPSAGPHTGAAGQQQKGFKAFAATNYLLSRERYLKSVPKGGG